MMCQECQMRPATVHITKIVNNQKSQIHLCEECAKQKQMSFSAGLAALDLMIPVFSGKTTFKFFETSSRV